MSDIKSDHAYLTSKGWKLCGGMWADYVYRSLKTTRDAVAMEKARENCRHADTLNIKGQKRCLTCGNPVPSMSSGVEQSGSSSAP